MYLHQDSFYRSEIFSERIVKDKMLANVLCFLGIERAKSSDFNEDLFC